MDRSGRHRPPRRDRGRKRRHRRGKRRHARRPRQYRRGGKPRQSHQKNIRKNRHLNKRIQRKPAGRILPAGALLI